MKRIFIIFTILSLVSSCAGVDKAEKKADEYHEKLDAQDYDYIIDNMCDDMLIEDASEEGMMDFFLLVESWGAQTNRTKDSGFSIKTNDDYTTVKLNYTFENNIGTMYEGLILIDRGEGYKMLTILYNENKSVIDNELADY